MAGTIGIGMVWGWLLILIGDPLVKPWRNGLLLTLATLPVAAMVWALGGQSLLFVATAVITLIIHIAWRSQLHQRTQSPSPQES